MSRERYVTDDPAWGDQGRQDIIVYRRSQGGSLGLGAFRASRFGRSEGGGVADAYRALWPRAYGNVRMQLVPGAVVLPASDVSAEVYQGFPGGWEPSVGVRRLGYADPVFVTALSVGKYIGDRWYGRLRGARAGRREDGAGASGSALVRRYLGTTHEFVELAGGAGKEAVIAGITPTDAADVDIRRTRFIEASGRKYVTPRVGLSLSAGFRTFEGIPDQAGTRVSVLLRW